MLGYQPWRCMEHNVIADVVKPRWFLKIVWENFLVNNLHFVMYESTKGLKSNITCKLCAWDIFIILFTGLLCDNSNSLITYEPRKGQSPILSRASDVWRKDKESECIRLNQLRAAVLISINVQQTAVPSRLLILLHWSIQNSSSS